MQPAHDPYEGSMRRLIGFVLAALLLHIPPASSGSQATTPDEPSVVATVDTTLSTGSAQIRQLAFDGDPETYFASEENARATDQFTLTFDAPVAVKAIAVVARRSDGSDALTTGTLEVSDDGKAFTELAKFADGAARGEPNGQKIQAVRIRPGSDLKHALAIREITIESDPPVAIFKYPVEIIVDVTDAPEMKEWAESAARICERAYPMINEELKSDGFRPRRLITMRLKTDYDGVANARGGRILGSVRFFKAHPDDFGAMIHETAHIVQQYTGRNPTWLVEGVSDYVRFFKFEPGKLGPIDAQRAHYNHSYRVTAAFLAYLTEKYDKDIVRKLNKLMRDGEYKPEVFHELTGKDLPELDEEWRATLAR
jgi:hypothetical protein